MTKVVGVPDGTVGGAKNPRRKPKGVALQNESGTIRVD